VKLLLPSVKPSLRLLLTALITLAATGCRRPQTQNDLQIALQSWGLPRDLSSVLLNRKHPLQTLALPPAVGRLDWLPDGLNTLILRGGDIGDARNLPSSLTALDLCNTKVRGRLSFPRGLRSLDLRKTGLKQVPILPQNLRQLAMGDRTAELPNHLPSGLRTLSIEDTLWSELPPLPGHLRALALRMPRLQELPELPASVRLLVLANTQLTTLNNLPRALDTLALLRNSVGLEEIDFPDLLTKLVISDVRAGAMRRLNRHLRSLELSQFLLDSWGSLPRSLEALRLNSVRARDSTPPSLPPGIRQLSLIRVASLPPLPTSLDFLEVDRSSSPPRLGNLTIGSLVLRSDGNSRPDLPASLERLEIIGGDWMPRLDRLSALKAFTLSGAQVPSLGPLPSSLEYLDLSSSTFGGLADLDHLALRYLILSRTDLSTLPRLPPTLKYLDISFTSMRELPALPDGLLTLVLEENQLDSIATLPESLRHLFFLPSTGIEPCKEPLSLTYANLGLDSEQRR
jgi:hypothetical protein